MNFLSHYYFDRHSTDPNLVIGAVLPDLVKNADKKWSLHPNKNAALFSGDPALEGMLDGWRRHLEVDKHFHASPFFFKHTAALRQQIAPLLEHSEARPSFVAHVALELLLDGLLITESLVDVNAFYTHLHRVDPAHIDRFLRLSKVPEPAPFFRFYQVFLHSAYLHSYKDTHQVVYALNRICQRIWYDPFDDVQQKGLALVLLDYLEVLRDDFTDIFSEITLFLSSPHVRPGDQA